MKLHFDIQNLLLTSLIPFLLVSACNKKVTNITSSTKEGGQDSGGGDTYGSTYGQVEYYFLNKEKLTTELEEIISNLLNHSQFGFQPWRKYDPTVPINRNSFQKMYPQLAEDLESRLNKVEFEEDMINEKGIVNTEPSKAPPVPGDFDDPLGLQRSLSTPVPKNRAYDESEIIKKYKKTISSPQTDAIIDYQQLFSSDTIDYASKPIVNISHLIKKIKIVLEYNNPCRDRHQQNKTAAVNSFSLDSSICLSIKELAKIPPESLQKQIHALLIHELMHVLGFYEDDAVKVQKFILENYNEYFNSKNVNYVIKATLFSKADQLKKALDLILLNYKRTDFGTPKLYANPIFRGDIEVLYGISQDARLLSDAYIEQIDFQKSKSDSNFKMTGMLYQLKNMLIEIESLYEFLNMNPEFGFRLTSAEDHYFIYDRIFYFSEKLKNMNIEIQSL